MCGIVGYIGKNKKAKDAVIKGLERLEYRGYDSSGIAYVNDNEVVIQKEKGRIKNLKDEINFDEKSNIAIGHTRWATHGEPNKKNSHPHKSGKITIVHNGIIENYIELRKKLESLGYEFTWLDDMPQGWRKAFGKKMIKELDKILRKANYQNEYQIAQIKEKWRWVTLVL